MRSLVAILLLILGFGSAALVIGLNTHEPLPVDPAWELSSAESVPAGAVRVRFTGTSTLVFSDGETSWMVDGWFTRFGALPMVWGTIEPDVQAIAEGLARNGVDELAAVIPVHSHFDHAMDAPEVARRTGALLVGSESTANIGRGWGLAEERIRVAEDRQPMRFGDFTLTLIHSRHFEFPDPEMRARALGDPRIETPLVPPVGVFEYKVGQPYAIHVSHPKGRFLIQASAGFVDGGLEDFPAETVFLGIGGIETQTEAYRERYWRETVEAVGASRVIPIHYDSLTGPIEGPFTGEVKAAAFLSAGGESLRAYLEAKLAGSSDLQIGTLPRYAPVVLFP